MPASWNKEYNPALLAEKIESTRKVSDDGKIRFEGLGFKEFAALLYSMLNFTQDIPEIDLRQIVSKAIFNSGAKGIITAKSLLAEVNKLEQEYQKLSTQRYVLVSSISIDPSLELHKIHLGNKLIVFEKSLPIRFKQEAGNLLRDAEQSLFANPPANYMQVRVHVSAKSIHDGAKQALETLDFVRGVWNWAYNRRHFIRETWGGKPKPVNQIILGPIHTLHNNNGYLAATNNWWYEPSYLGAIQTLNPKRDEIDGIYNALNHVRKKFETHKYSDSIKEAFIRYTRALDERNWSIAFLKLWSILELLTDTIGTSYETTIKRASYIYEERDYHLQVLEHLRKYRNSSIHFDKDNSEMETYLYQIKNYVEALIGFHINNRLGFESIQETASFLNLPYDKEVINRQIEKLSFAKKFHGFSK